MAEYSNKKECLYQNLTDAKCPGDLRDRCMALAAGDEKGRMIKELKRHRGSILENIHEQEKALDSLDYLIFQMEKERRDEH